MADLFNSLRNKETYLDKIPKESVGTMSCERGALTNFEAFSEWKFHVSTESVIAGLRKFEGNRQESTIYEILQNFSNYMIEEKELTIRTARNYVKRMKNYLNYLLEIKIHNEDLRQNIRYPRAEQRDNYPLSTEEARACLQEARTKKVMYLFGMGTGIAIGEAMQLRKRDFVRDKMSRIMVYVPAKYRKVRVAKRTFVPKWIEKEILSILDSVKDDDLVFAKNKNWRNAAINEILVFVRVRQRAGLDNLVYDTGIHKITIHSFRSWFITRANKVDHGLGNALAGQGYYMKRYDRYTEQEMLEFFLKAEPLLNPYESQEDKKQREVIDEMHKTIQQLKRESDRQKLNIKRLEKKTAKSTA